MGTTTNNGWPTPVATDLVKDGWEAIKDLGDAIDTTLGVYAPPATGLTLINTTSFSGVTSTSLPASTFTSTYTNYKVILNISSVSGTNPYIHFRMRASGTDNSSSIYTWNESTSNSNAAAVVVDYSNGAGAQWLIGKANTSNMSNKIIDILNPFATQVTAFSCLSQSYNVVASNSSNSLIQGTTTATTSFDSASFYVTSGNLTGTYSVFGYNA